MHARMSRRLHQVALAALLVLLLMPILPGVVVRAATYTVTNANDSGPGSLRDAIFSSLQGPGGETINFSIGSGLKTIVLASPLLPLAKPVTIDATTQPGYVVAPLIEVRGSNLGPGVVGFWLNGGSTTIKGLLINGFGDSGVYIASNGNTVQGNWIGTDASGAAALPNITGVNIASGSGNVIGGTTAAARNVISGNSAAGIQLAGTGTTNNQIQGNFIGTNASGTAAVPSPKGVYIFGAPGNTVGGVVAGAGNLISGNTTGVAIIDQALGSSINNQVSGNFIGTNVTGNAAIANVVGVAILNSSYNVVGGIGAAARNLISGNTLGGVTIDGSGAGATAVGNVVQGNWIGTDVTGNTMVGHTDEGIYIKVSSSNTIGGTSPGAGNVIVGCISTGLVIDGLSGPATGNLVQGNFIGTNTAGNVSLPNGTQSGAGIYIASADGNTIGGTVAGARNLISGNAGSGVIIDGFRTSSPTVLGSSSNNLIQGNWVGLNGAGTGALPNSGGVAISTASGNTIGGTSSAARNVISGNLQFGVSINTLVYNGQTGPASNNNVQGNFIGTNPTGTAAIPNGGGITIAAASGNTIGGTAAGAGNLISGNTNHGIYMNGAFIPPGAAGPPGITGMLVQGNFIGTDVTGKGAIGNGGRGIQLDSASNNTIGGNSAAESNVIAFNSQQGVSSMALPMAPPATRSSATRSTGTARRASNLPRAATMTSRRRS